MILSKENTKEYIWGNHCKGWPLVDTTALSVKEELMPPGTEEVLHKHNKAQQFFYILKGCATFLIEDRVHTVKANEGIHLHPHTIHKIKNETEEDLEFLVISQPSAHGDREEIK